MSFRLFKFFVLVVAVAALSSCSAFKEKEDISALPVEVLYNKAADALEEEDYARATQYFEEVERQYPYSKWATQAQLMAAYSYYQGQAYDDAVAALDRFIELYPGNEKIDYAYYLRALCFYEQIADVRRDQELTQEALKALDTLIRLYPDSVYTRDARLKKDLALDHLAGKEMEIGRYYLSRGHINAAINRFRNVVRSYQTTTHVAEALHRLVECYLTLGLVDEATHIAAVLGYNYPGNSWYKRSYDLLDPAQRQKVLDDRNFVDRTVESIFKPE